ncbi:hypothetical protein EXIGLDRAFT_22079 [Exidia glandulosa HHB12029]|uniref:AB hydrolase-1 domain-containing protein n=1 Tax=Exidia glandulosa HHB12029 TaxID=1314781 RepID=A0A165QZX0_EXIGL|nr:hypothetical protein EXIGLDRAFT_22079 [Exidia glandulosa HHB12029]
MPHLHLIYIHGFRGDHTSFQAFPTDIYNSVRPRLPPHVELSSYLYPTYPSVRPVAYAVQQFLIWLAKQPPGPVILFAHSMGGLLAAEAAISPEASAQRIVGLVGLDVPFLGLHPHVIISGIASLVSKDDAPVGKEADMNSSKVHVVHERDAFAHPATNDTDSDARSTSSSSSGKKSLAETFTSFTTFVDKHRAHPVVQFLNRHADDPLGGVHQWIVKNLEFGSSMYDAPGLLHRYDALVHWRGKWLNYWTTTVPLPGVDPAFCPELLEVPSSPPPAALTPGLGKESAHPVLTLPFGLLSKKDKDETPKWWHSALPAEHELYEKVASYFSPKKDRDRPDESSAMLSPNVGGSNPLSSSSTSLSSTSSSSAEHRPHHFIVLPYNSGNRRAKWHCITITGAKDEVTAHQGIFMRDKNPDYDLFVDRVARLVELWSRDL